MSTKLRIIAAMKEIAAEQKVNLPPLTDDLSLHETGFDSLAFAILVARLEDDLGIDPFTISEDAAFPLTVGDFVRAYENVPASGFRASRLSEPGAQGPRHCRCAAQRLADRYPVVHLSRRLPQQAVGAFGAAVDVR